MKIKKKLFIIIIIFSILQLFSAIYINSVHAEDSIIDKAFKDGGTWDNMGSKEADNIMNQANGVFEETVTLKDRVKVIGASIFIFYFAITIIMLSRGDIQDKAKVKLHLGLSLGLAILFIFSDVVFETIESILKSFVDIAS